MHKNPEDIVDEMLKEITTDKKYKSDGSLALICNVNEFMEDIYTAIEFNDFETFDKLDNPPDTFKQILKDLKKMKGKPNHTKYNLLCKLENYLFINQISKKEN